jgi:hypothetical protein
MSIYYSKSERGFYHTDTFEEDQMPSDKVEITQERFDELMEQQASGLEIDGDDDGNPIAREHVPPPATEDDVRYLRDHLLVREVDPIVTNPLRWAELSPDKQAEWTQYRRDLLDITEQSGFPTNVVWPTKP